MSDAIEALDKQLKHFQKCINCLALQVPEEVWRDVNRQYGILLDNLSTALKERENQIENLDMSDLAVLVGALGRAKEFLPDDKIIGDAYDLIMDAYAPPSKPEK